jgi:hypothetical protein
MVARLEGMPEIVTKRAGRSAECGSSGDITMPVFDLPAVGPTDFPAGTGGHWQFDLPLRGGDVPVDINSDDETFTRDMLAEIAIFISDAARFDEISRDAFKAEFDEKPEGTVGTYLSHHAEELGEKDLLRIFGIEDPDDLDINHLLEALQLKRIGLYPGADGYVAVFDYTIDEEATDYLLVVEYDSDGEVFGISMDS